MMIRLLGILTLALCTGTFATANDSDGDDPDGPRPVGVSSNIPNNHSLTNGVLWTSVGFGVVDSYFNGQAEMQDMGSGEIPTVGNIETNAKITTIILHVGGSYTVGRVEGWDINLGADLGLAKQQLTADAVPGVVEATDQSTGLIPQNLALVGEASSSNYTIRTGYLADLARHGNENELETTDREHAVLVGVERETSLDALHLFGGIDYFLTLPSTRIERRQSAAGIRRITVDDRGDLLNARIGAGLQYRSIEFGVTALYRINGKSGLTDGEVRQLAEFGTPNEFDRGNVFSLSPYFTVAPAQFPMQFYLKGALQREYHDYGIAISGSNDIAPRLGGSFGVIYNF